MSSINNYLAINCKWGRFELPRPVDSNPISINADQTSTISDPQVVNPDLKVAIENVSSKAKELSQDPISNVQTEKTCKDLAIGIVKLDELLINGLIEECGDNLNKDQVQQLASLSHNLTANLASRVLEREIHRVVPEVKIFKSFDDLRTHLFKALTTIKEESFVSNHKSKNNQKTAKEKWKMFNFRLNQQKTSNYTYDGRVTQWEKATPETIPTFDPKYKDESLDLDEVRRLHHLPGMDILISNEYVKKNYFFPTQKVLGYGALAIMYDKQTNNILKCGVIYLAFNDNNKIYHSFLTPYEQLPNNLQQILDGVVEKIKVPDNSTEAKFTHTSKWEFIIDDDKLIVDFLQETYAVSIISKKNWPSKKN